MKIRRTHRWIGLMLAMLMALSGVPALADIISTGGANIPTYNSRDQNDMSDSGVSFFDTQATNQGGWYKIGDKWVQAAHVTVVATDPPTTDGGTGTGTTPTATATATLAPGQTATPLPSGVTASPRPDPTPTQAVIKGDKDSTYAGQVLSYTVPSGTGGLWLYNQMNGNAVENIPEGRTVKLTEYLIGCGCRGVHDNGPCSCIDPLDPTSACTCPTQATWYSIYHNGRTYYVKAENLVFGGAGTQVPTGQIRSIVVAENKMIDPVTNAEVLIYPTYYSTYSRTASPRLSNPAGELVPGKRINATYVDDQVYSFANGSTTYYFYASDVASNSQSSASVVGNEDVSFVTRITIPSGATLKLYAQASTDFEDYYELTAPATSTITLNAENADRDGWYRVVYSNRYYYVLKTDAANMDVEQVVNDPNLQTQTFWVTAGVDGAKMYETYTGAAVNPPYDTTANYINPGVNVRVGAVNANWYSYNDGTAVYYVNKKDFSGYATDTNAVSAYRVKLPANTALYDRMGTDVPAVRLPQEGWHVVNSINEQYFSIDYSSRTYYLKKSELPQFAAGDIEEIASSTDGRTYQVTIGVSGAQLYTASDCSGTPALSYPPGTTLTATRYSASLYTVTISNVRYFMPVSCIASIKGGDDNSGPGKQQDESIGEVVQGVKDETYNGTVFSYTIPARGLWLYHDTALTRPALSLDAGRSIQLSEDQNNLAASYYTTMYNGTLYYVPKAQLKASEDDMKTGTGLSITLSSTVELYATVACNNTGNRTTGKTGETIPAGTRINVTVASYLTTAEKNQMPMSIVPDPKKNYVRAYSTQYGGATRYFLAYSQIGSSASYINDPNETLLAQIASNTDVNLLTQFTINAPATGENEFRLHTTDSTTSGAKTIRVAAGEAPVTFYGVKYATDWYKVVYDNSVWYLHYPTYQQAVASGQAGNTQQVPVAGAVASNTYTVVIKAGGVKAYTQPTANDQYLHANSPLLGGIAVMATASSNGWYSCLYPGTSEVVYFQNTGASNTNANAGINSYVLTIPAGHTPDPITVYSTISTTAETPVRITGFGLQAGETYTLRRIDSTWSSVTLSGRTYYVKNAQLPASSVQSAVQVGSTSVGKTYTITIGYADAMSAQNSVTMYQDSLLTQPHGTKVPAGHTTQGTKMYVENAVGSKSGLVFKITYAGATGYIDSKYVIGVANGDETDEAREAESIDESAKLMEVGQSKYFTLNAGTRLYASMSTSADTITLGSTSTYLLTRVDATWFKLTHNGQVYYVPVNDVATGTGTSGGATGGANIAVGESFTHWLTKAATAYSQPSTNAQVVGTAQANQMLRLTKVSDYWYELDWGTRKVYLTAADVFGAPAEGGSSSGGTGTGTGQTTTDGTGIITDQIRISPASGTVNLRKSASTGSTIMERIPKDTIVTNIGYEIDANGQIWYKTSYKGKTGYVIGTYVQAVGTVSSGGSSVDPSSDIGRTLTVDVVTVNIRSGAGTNYSIIGRLDRNAAVVPLSYHKGTDGMIWYSFQYAANTVGYIRYDYVRGGVASTTELSGNVAIKSGGTNLRSGAGSGFSVKAKLERDMVVTIVGSGTDSDNVLWYRVTYQNLNGYVRSDLVRALTSGESAGLFEGITNSYTDLRYGSSGEAVAALQRQLIALGYLTGNADGTYGMQTTEAVSAFQRANGMTATGVATSSVQAAIFNTTSVSSGSSRTLDWFNGGYTLINANPNIQVYDIGSGVTWNAKYVEGANHADVVPASSSDAQKLKANNITGSYVRRPVLVTIAGQRYAGSMYAVGHGTANFVSYFSGVMCIHFSGSKTHGTGNVDADHQSAINQALQYSNR